jgi:serine/threonine-protein kinase HipA
LYRAVDIIEVRAWDQLVGAIARDPRLGYYAFEYASTFVERGIELAPLTMPVRDAHQPFIFPELPELTFKRLPSMLADSLPDDFGNSLIDAWMAQQGVTREDIGALDRLAYMSRRAFGALEFRPARGPQSRSATAIELSTLVESARRVVHGELGDDRHAHAALLQILSVGTSAGGARAKASIAWNPSTNEIRAGQFDVEPGFEHWLLKFDGIDQGRELGASRGFGRIEYAYHLMAIQAGITMAPCRLLEESGRAHFMTRRFDREGNKKIHTQTLCGIAQLDYRAKGTNDYGQYLDTLRRLELGPAEFEQAFRRIAFNVMAGNCDDHTKNVSFMLRDRKAWKLAPAYDVIYAYNPSGAWTYQHLMSVNGKFADINRSDLLVLADRYQIGAAHKLLEQVNAAVAAWPDFARQAAVSETIVARIRENQKLI